MVKSAFQVARALLTSLGFDIDERYTPTLVQEIDDLLKRGKEKGDKVAVLSEVKSKMEDAKVAVYKHVAPPRAGVSSKNRSRLGVVGGDSQWLGKTILDQGWDDTRTRESSAFDLPPPPLDREEREFNQRLIELGDGLIPPLEDLDVTTVGGSHTNTFLRQVLGEVPAVVAELSDTNEVGGRIDYNQLVCNRPAFKSATETGLKYWCGHWQSVYIWPELPDFLQDGLNITAKLIVSEPEIRLKLSNMAAAAERAGEPLEWKHYEKAAARSNPACLNWIDKLSTYVQSHGDGVDGELVAEFAEFAKTLETTGPKRLLGAEFFDKVNKLSFGRGVRFPRVVNATLELQLAGPKVTNGNICNFLTSANLNELVKESNRSAVAKAEELMSEARELVKGLGLQRSKIVKFVGRLDVRACAILTKTSKTLEGKASTMSEVAEQFLADLSRVHGEDIAWDLVRKGGPQPDPASAAKTQAQDASAASVDTVLEMSDMVHQAKKLGYSVGAYTTCKTDDDPKVYKLKAYEGTRAEMVLQEAGHDTDSVTVEVADLLKTWRIHKGGVTSLLPGWSADTDCSPLATKSFKFDLAKSKAMLAIAKVFERYHGQNVGDIELLVKPHSVRAATEIAIGDLTLAPCSTKIDRKCNDGSWFLGKFDIGEDEETPLYMGPMMVPPISSNGQPNKAPWVVPFFMVCADPEQGNANCEVRHVTLDGVKVPVLTNFKKLNQKDELKFYKAQMTDFASCRKVLKEQEPASKKRKTK